MSFEEQLVEIFQDKYTKNQQSNTPLFESKTRPNISINEYYYRILKFTHCDKSVVSLVWVLLKRLVFMYGIILTELNIHRLVSQAFNISLKFIDDDHPVILHKIFGYSKKEFFYLEKEFLKIIEYDIMTGILFSDKNFIQT